MVQGPEGQEADGQAMPGWECPEEAAVGSPRSVPTGGVATADIAVRLGPIGNPGCCHLQGGSLLRLGHVPPSRDWHLHCSCLSLCIGNPRSNSSKNLGGFYSF